MVVLALASKMKGVVGWIKERWQRGRSQGIGEVRGGESGLGEGKGWLKVLLQGRMGAWVPWSNFSNNNNNSNALKHPRMEACKSQTKPIDSHTPFSSS